MTAAADAKTRLDLPKSIESYYQEMRRAGRDVKTSNACMIYGLEDFVKLSQMLETTDADESYKKVARHKLDSMVARCETGSCLLSPLYTLDTFLG